MQRSGQLIICKTLGDVGTLHSKNILTGDKRRLVHEIRDLRKAKRKEVHNGER